jgi:hypothetical protein
MTAILNVGEGTGDDISFKGPKTVECLVLCLIIAFCVIGNASLWIVVLSSKGLRTVTNMFILGLSAAGNDYILFECRHYNHFDLFSLFETGNVF